MKKNYFYFLPVLFLLPLISLSQDNFSSLSQFYTSPLNFNPASTGLHNGLYRVTADARNQFGDLSSSTNSFKNFIFSFDVPIKRFGIGAIVKAESQGLFTNLEAGLSLAYSFALNKKKNHNLAIGVQGVAIQQNFNTSKASFPQTPEEIANPNIINPELNAGLFYYNSNLSAKFNPFLGVSAYRILQLNLQGFTNTGTSGILNARKFNAFGGVQFNANKKFDVVPHALVTYQDQTQQYEANAGILTHYFLRDDDASLLLGGSYRLNTAYIAQVGLQYRDFMFGFSYDFFVAPLATAISTGNDGFEISFIYIKRRNIRFKEDYICPRL